MYQGFDWPLIEIWSIAIFRECVWFHCNGLCYGAQECSCTSSAGVIWTFCRGIESKGMLLCCVPKQVGNLSFLSQKDGWLLDILAVSWFMGTCVKSNWCIEIIWWKTHLLLAILQTSAIMGLKTGWSPRWVVAIPRKPYPGLPASQQIFRRVLYIYSDRMQYTPSASMYLDGAKADMEVYNGGRGVNCVVVSWFKMNALILATIVS